jgi:hypothetical protein
MSSQPHILPSLKHIMLAAYFLPLKPTSVIPYSTLQEEAKKWADCVDL